MKFEKYLLSIRLNRHMTHFAAQESDDLTRRCHESPDGQSGDADIASFLKHASESLAFFEDVDPYSPEPMKPYLDKANRFLERYGDTNYDSFIRGVDVRSLRGKDFDDAPKNSIKKRLFIYRARVLLSALDSCAQEGIDIPSLLKKLKGVPVPCIKEGDNEPTYQKILEQLQKRNAA